MTPYIEGLRTGAWRLAPVEATAEMVVAGEVAEIRDGDGQPHDPESFYTDYVPAPPARLALGDRT